MHGSGQMMKSGHSQGNWYPFLSNKALLCCYFISNQRMYIHVTRQANLNLRVILSLLRAKHTLCLQTYVFQAKLGAYT